jgi:hypothetical protein
MFCLYQHSNLRGFLTSLINESTTLTGAFCRRQDPNAAYNLQVDSIIESSLSRTQQGNEFLTSNGRPLSERE